MTHQPNRRRSKPQRKASPARTSLLVRMTPEEREMLRALEERIRASATETRRFLIRQEFRFGCSQGHRGGLDDPDR